MEQDPGQSWKCSLAVHARRLDGNPLTWLPNHNIFESSVIYLSFKELVLGHPLSKSVRWKSTQSGHITHRSIGSFHGRLNSIMAFQRSGTRKRKKTQNTFCFQNKTYRSRNLIFPRRGIWATFSLLIQNAACLLEITSYIWCVTILNPLKYGLAYQLYFRFNFPLPD